MKIVRECLSVVCLALLAFSLGVVAWHAPRWAKSLDLISVHADQFAGEGAKAMKDLAESSRQSKQTTKFINDQLPGTLTKLNTILDAADVAMNEARGTLQAGTIVLGTANQAIADADYKLDQLTSGINESLREVPPTLQASQRVMGSLDSYIGGPLTSTTNEAHDIMVPAQWMMYDLQRKEHEWLFPVQQKKRLGLLRTTVNIVRTSAQPSYYLFKIGRGN